MDISKLLLKVPGAIYNRSQRKIAEKEHKMVLNAMMPIIEDYLNSQKTNKDFERYNEIFQRRATKLNYELRLLKVNVNYFVSHLSSHSEPQLKEKVSYKYLAYSIIVIIILIIMSIFISYICSV